MVYDGAPFTGRTDTGPHGSERDVLRAPFTTWRGSGECCMKRKPRVRMHLVDESRSQLPSVEGVLVSRRRKEYMIAVPKLVIAAGRDPEELEARWLTIPRERVAFYEVL